MNEQPSGTPGHFEPLRGRLFGVAYRMLGSRSEAEDVVQETYIRWHGAQRGSIRNAEAWLVTTATRLAIDRLRVLKAERQSYVGPWLPEPLVNEELPAPDRLVELADDLSVAFLVLLERLSPEERAAFLLHDVFDCGYGEIAQVLSRSGAACRQIVHRARDRARRDRKRFDVADGARASLVQKFRAAVEAQDGQTLLALFAPDATWIADGGGRAPALPDPLVGRERIVKLILGYWTRFRRQGATIHLASVSGETGLYIRLDGHLQSVLSFETDGERILRVNVILNPDKLAAHLGRPRLRRADMSAALSGSCFDTRA